MFDFDKPIFENAQGRVLVCAHRGSSGGNVPCNTLTAFKTAVTQGADIIELDVDKSREGEFFVFHPFMEPAHIGTRFLIPSRSSKSVARLRFLNQDDTKTQYGVEKLADIFDYLRGKCYINVDKFWTDIPGITSVIRKTGVEKQVIVKTAMKDKYLAQLKEYASDLMFMPIVKSKDEITDKLCEQGINCIGAEVIFKDLSESVASKEYIDHMHSKGRLVFVNTIVYDYKSILAADLTDDRAVSGEADEVWGKLAQMGFDIIQTDWCLDAKTYFAGKGM